jgi:hypothetical protein
MNSGVVVDVLGKTSVGLMVCIVKKSIPSVRLTILDIGFELIRLVRHSLINGMQIIETALSGYLAL